MWAISWDLLAPVQYNHQYILGWSLPRITEKGSSETQEYNFVSMALQIEIASAVTWLQGYVLYLIAEFGQNTSTLD